MTTEPTPAEVRVDRQVRPTLSEALKAYWKEAQRAARDDYDLDDKGADFALRDVIRAVADLLNAERAAERERWKAAAAAMFAADDEYGCGFYSYGGWVDAYAHLRAMVKA